MKVSINGPYEVRIDIDATKTKYGYQDYNLSNEEINKALAHYFATELKSGNSEIAKKAILKALTDLDFELEEGSDWLEIVAEYYEGKTEDLELWD